jgi:hypothetical protein
MNIGAMIQAKKDQFRERQYDKQKALLVKQREDLGKEQVRRGEIVKLQRDVEAIRGSKANKIYERAEKPQNKFMAFGKGLANVIGKAQTLSKEHKAKVEKKHKNVFGVPKSRNPFI